MKISRGWGLSVFLWGSVLHGFCVRSYFDGILFPVSCYFFRMWVLGSNTKKPPTSDSNLLLLILEETDYGGLVVRDSLYTVRWRFILLSVTLPRRSHRVRMSLSTLNCPLMFTAFRETVMLELVFVSFIISLGFFRLRNTMWLHSSRCSFIFGSSWGLIWLSWGGMIVGTFSCPHGKSPHS